MTLLHKFQAREFPGALLVDEDRLRTDVVVDDFRRVVQIHERFGDLCVPEW